jgi:hypothetical protein
MWDVDFSMCPSQSHCFKHIKQGGVDFMLYLRWRWEDPWEGYIIKNVANRSEIYNGEWSDDKLDLFGFKHNEYKDAQIALETMHKIIYAKQKNGGERNA